MSDNPNLLLQDCSRKLFRWFLSKPDSRKEPRVKKFQSEWDKMMGDFTFPDNMPEEIRLRAINRRRQVMIHSYVRNGIGMELISTKLFTKICQELEDIQAAWGHEFNFYDYMFDGFDKSHEDKLVTNLGCDDLMVKHALGMVAARKQWERKMAY